MNCTDKTCKECKFFMSYQNHPNHFSCWNEKGGRNYPETIGKESPACHDFTPKKPEKKVKKKHSNCKFGELSALTDPCETCMDGPIDENGIHTSLWQPLPKPKTDDEAGQVKPEIKKPCCSECKTFATRWRHGQYKSCKECLKDHYSKFIPKDKSKFYETIDKIIRDTIVPNRKENKMWKKLRKRGRRITMAWDLFGVFLLCKLVNPWVCKFWYLVPIKQNSGGWDEVKNGGQTILPWFFTILTIAVILAALYALDRLAAWWYGEK